MATKQSIRKASMITVLLSVLAIGGMVGYKAVQLEAVVTVETVTLDVQTVNETVLCTGTVTAGDGTDVYVSMPCVAGDVAVQVGDHVQKGDVLFTVDRAATLAMAVSAGVSAPKETAVSAMLPQTVTAPMSGIVSAIGVQKGDVLGADTPCAVVSESDGIQIALAVKESVLSQLAVGQNVTVSGVAFKKETYKGVLSHIASSARSRVNATGGETVVDACVTLCEGETDESLLIGLSAKAEVLVQTYNDVLLLPYECLAQDADGAMYVYCVNGDTALRKYVTVAEELRDGVKVINGVTQGERVVRFPERLRGERVQVTAKEVL